MKLNDVVASIKPVDKEMYKKAVERTGNLIMPPRAMGRLNDLSEQLAAISGTLSPEYTKKAVFVMAGDHGVTEEGVSAFPQEVTIQMMGAFTAGMATISVLSRVNDVRVVVTDVGSLGDIPEGKISDKADFLVRKVANGTKNLAKEPAMTRAQAEQSVMTGYEVAVEYIEKEGLDLITTGDMGIANTTPSAAIGAVYTGASVDIMTGRGSGIDDQALKHKTNVIKQALDMHKPDKNDAIDVLSKVGGFEIGAIAGAMLAGAAKGLPVLVDGVISTAGALIAAGLCPSAKEYMIAGHRSVEPGQIKMLEYLGLDPLLSLGMRLGEGTGAVVAMSIVDSAAAIMREVKTFAEAGVSVKE
ncbi:nicotinate-nucleotide/dimethylbenzimidazole phosphoribosyltransferase [Denitrovibrio acetiphilus DSM 12809]|uniref:Nicotinate-nucleotide--dimethylbenzimidazole phosphoribosyltransferase n=1 Tax=Denitrovibrio acetiphilus (strain DSM 12809 / NBRC 114555 / N2460) TaxID=522772 RepID=D4H1X6_DENA2|nr:nicotinate-nucleotide--dimethylbenzimidazole phosphoribosyltransferase [Denitrovibrio acetiphilus]ADD66953.1 nicotinate-nucleotide/dimethylbenzimidazole phosphoribosyltransferase [Denitrovibrio acetiphilus DSM 12809]